MDSLERHDARVDDGAQPARRAERADAADHVTRRPLRDPRLCQAGSARTDCLGKSPEIQIRVDRDDGNHQLFVGFDNQGFADGIWVDPERRRGLDSVRRATRPRVAMALGWFVGMHLVRDARPPKQGDRTGPSGAHERIVDEPITTDTLAIRYPRAARTLSRRR